MDNWGRILFRRFLTADGCRTGTAIAGQRLQHRQIVGGRGEKVSLDHLAVELFGQIDALFRLVAFGDNLQTEIVLQGR